MLVTLREDTCKLILNSWGGSLQISCLYFNILKYFFCIGQLRSILQLPFSFYFFDCNIFITTYSLSEQDPKVILQKVSVAKIEKVKKLHYRGQPQLSNEKKINMWKCKWELAKIFPIYLELACKCLHLTGQELCFKSSFHFSMITG